MALNFSTAASAYNIKVISVTTTAATLIGAKGGVGIGGRVSDVLSNTSLTATTAAVVTTPPSWLSGGRIQIPLYATILMLAVIGNFLVIITLVQNRRMRTITNVFLLNLAVSDLLLGVLCMPFTLIGALLRDFVFGEVMCKVLPYLQASSVSVSAWTLVAISCERYYAICHPLRSRRWQTLKHSYKLIALIWCGSLICMSPIAFLSKLIPTSNGHHKCREQWPEDSIGYERSFNILLDIVLLLVPLLLLASTYSLITKTLWKGMIAERISRRQSKLDNKQLTKTHKKRVYLNSSSNGQARNRCPLAYHSHQPRENIVWHQIRDDDYPQESHIAGSKKLSFGLRRTNTEKSLQNKKRVIKMLFVVVLEFFICWTPLYVINTIALFNAQLVYQKLGYQTISFFQLLAYSSSCCNPITYCFMNRGFRKACLNLFRCCKRYDDKRRISIVGGVTQSSEVT